MTARRLAAILAADVVGYRRMMGEDEAGTAKSVRESRAAAGPIIAAHGGRMFKTMGDGFSSSFRPWSLRSSARWRCRPTRCG